MKTSIEPKRYDNDRIKQKYIKKTQPKWPFVRNKSHTDFHGIERDLEGWNLAQDIFKDKIRTAQ